MDWAAETSVAAAGPKPSALGARTRAVTIARRVIGAVLVLAGSVWLGQGLGLIGGSSMTGSTFWAVAGVVCIVAGLGLLSWPWRQTHAQL
jgi:hypothetical protein